MRGVFPHNIHTRPRTHAVPAHEVSGSSLTHWSGLTDVVFRGCFRPTGSFFFSSRWCMSWNVRRNSYTHRNLYTTQRILCSSGVGGPRTFGMLCSACSSNRVPTGGWSTLQRYTWPCGHPPAQWDLAKLQLWHSTWKPSGNPDFSNQVYNEALLHLRSFLWAHPPPLIWSIDRNTNSCSPQQAHAPPYAAITRALRALQLLFVASQARLRLS